MSAVLSTPQREQAGSDSYNRFEYQAHWIVCHIVNQLEKHPKCIVFCEYHDDMAQLNDGKGTPFEFYQIKTKEESGEWTIAELSAREKKKNGFYKKSFLGFIFYNFLTFGDECSCCHFTSNNNFDLDVRTWQAHIEDGEELKIVNPELYNRIKARIQAEYLEDLPYNFDKVFDRFIQKTFVYNSELQLSTYEVQVSGVFFNLLETRRIPTDTAHTIFRQILNDVRKKSKNKVMPPISFRSLVDKKGIQVNDINEKINKKIGIDGNYDDFSLYLSNISVSENDIERIIKAKQLHDARWLKIEDVKYQEIVVTIRKEIEAFYETIYSDFYVNFDQLRENCKKTLTEHKLESLVLDDNLIEVLYYERKYRTDNEK